MKPLQHKKHTLAKRGLSLLCVLALCLGLLPVTALAAGEDAPDKLYVGNQSVRNGDNTTYWTTNDSGELEKVKGTTDDSNDWTVRYNPNTATLTLKGAKISVGNATSSPPYGAGIYALCSSNQPVALTIELIGTNTITGHYGIYVNAEMSATSYGTNATLTITGENNGSLGVSGSDHGIYVKSGTGNASLNIKNVAVTSSTNGDSAAGVYVMSGSTATNSPNISLSVNGGSLTASGTGSSDGILFYVGSPQATGATTSLTVSENAIVDAKTGGISASNPNSSDLSDQINVDSGTGTNGGIVFDGNTGTVYGKVELQEDLEIGEGESLTIGQDASLTVPENKTLTNNGEINNSGTLPETISGNQPPKITTTSLPDGTVDAVYSQALATEGSPTNWSVTSGTLPAGLTLNSDGTITGTPTTANTYTFTVTATNSAGSTSRQFSLTINSVPVTDVSLDKDTLSLYTGDTASLTATVEPDNATNQNVTWSSNNAEVATVQNGTVTAVGAGEATITVQTQDGNYIATCKVTVTDKTYAISADPTALDFGSAYTGYGQPAAQTVTLTNTGNQQVTVTLPTANDFIITAGTGFTDGSAAIKPGETATFTVQPKAGLSAGTYSDTITVSGTNNATSAITASFTVTSRPSYNPPTVSEETTDAIADAQPGETVTVDLSSGSTTLDKEVFETLAGKDVTLVVELGDGLSWTVNGSDIPENADFTDIDLGVTMNSDGIPVDIINAITGEHGSVQMTLAHNGAFGFTMTLSAPLGTENAGLWANLYYYKVNDGEAGREGPLGDNESTNKMSFETAAKINSDGTASLSFSHASQYAIVIDDHNHGVVTLPFTDVADSDWFFDPVCFVYSQGLMTGTSATTFEPNTHLTRAMLVAMLHRLEGSPQASAGDFTDVADGDWYAEAVNWAASVGVVNGFDDGSFQPNTAITREQLAAILRNFAAYKGMDVSTSGDLSTYSDAASVSDWAQESVEWMVGSGLLGGYDDNTLRPQGTTTRAEVASVLQRALGNVAGNQ